MVEDEIAVANLECGREIDEIFVVVDERRPYLDVLDLERLDGTSVATVLLPVAGTVVVEEVGDYRLPGTVHRLVQLLVEVVGVVVGD